MAEKGVAALVFAAAVVLRPVDMARGQSSLSGASPMPGLGCMEFTENSYTIRRPARHGDAAEEIRRQICFSALVAIVQHLQANEDKILGTWATLSQGQVRTSALQDSEVTKTSWDDSYAKLQKIPKYWLMENISIMSKKKLTIDFLGRVDKKDPTAIRDIHDFGTWTRGQWTLPRSAIVKAVCREMFLQRHTEGGSLLADWAENEEYFTEDYTVDWAKHGAYRLEFDDSGIAVRMTHASGGQPYAFTAEDGQWKKGSVAVLSAMHHHTAQLKQGNSVFTCADAFPRGSGGNRMWNTKGAELLKLANDIAAAHAAAAASAASSSSAGPMLCIADRDAQSAADQVAQNERDRRTEAARQRRPTGPSGPSRRKSVRLE